MKKGLFILILPAFLILTLIVAPLDSLIVFAQSSEISLTQSERAALEAQLRDLEAQMAQKQKELANQQNYSGTLAGDIAVLTTKINQKKLEIKSKNLKITQLTASIGEKKVVIESLSEKIEKQKQSIGQLLRKTDEMDRTTLTSFLLSSKTLSTFYSDVSRFDKLKADVRASVEAIKQIKGVTEVKKAELEKAQNQAIDEKQALLQVQKTIEQDQATQKTLLSISKNKEKEYQKVIAEQQKKVGEIKARLFQLAGGAQAIRFDQALAYAQEAQRTTGIDPAFLLAELTQESNLGANVGKCYLQDASTGASIGVNTGKVFSNGMKLSRDVQPFLDITNKLGMNAFKTVVSCPIAGVAGYGGAMGPAQFIPSTWKLFEARLQSALGHYPNPWSAEDAFMAASMYLTDLGGVGTSASAQLRASCKYYGSGGSTCSYGRSVQSLKVGIQADIDYLVQYGISRR